VSTPPQPGIWYALAILAAALAVVLAIRRVDHRPIAVFLVVMTAIDLARLALAHVVDFDAAPRPHVGLVRFAFHIDELGFLAWPAGLAALALVVFAGRPYGLVRLAWAATGVCLIALYPSDLVRGAGLAQIYLAAELVALAVYVVTLARWGARRAAPSSAHAVLLVLGAVELARLVPFYGPVFQRWATYAGPTNVVLYAVIAAVQGGFLWVSSPSP
jgi:hypothetical protein